RTVTIASVPFRIGRGGEGRNDLALSDVRVSRQSIEVTFDGADFLLTDQGQRHGVFLNGRPVLASTALREGDVVTFGNTDAVSLGFRADEPRGPLRLLLPRFDAAPADENVDHDLPHLNLLQDATALLQARLHQDEVRGAMVDRAVTITDADRGVLLEV